MLAAADAAVVAEAVGCQVEMVTMLGRSVEQWKKISWATNKSQILRLIISGTVATEIRLITCMAMLIIMLQTV